VNANSYRVGVMSHPWALGREQPTPNSAMPRTSSKEELCTTSRFNRMRHGISLRKKATRGRGTVFAEASGPSSPVLLLTPSASAERRS
jgi:hypothetical protein